MIPFDRTGEFYRTAVRPKITYTRRSRIDILLDYVPGKRVLDLGCVEHEAAISEKTDWWVHGLIKERALSVTGVDYESPEVEILNQKGFDIRVANVEDMNLDTRFDVVMAGELFEHLTNHRSFLESVRRHLTPDGIFVASMPNANSLNYFMQTLVFGHEVDAWDHAAFFTPVTLSVMLEKCGFTAVKIILFQPDEIYHHTVLSHRVMAYLFNKLQQAACFIWPQLARGLIVVARSKD